MLMTEIFSYVHTNQIVYYRRVIHFDVALGFLNNAGKVITAMIDNNIQ